MDIVVPRVEERIVGVIPHLKGAAKLYGGIVTNERSVFVVKVGAEPLIGYLLAGGLGAAWAVSGLKDPHLPSLDPETIGREAGNVTIRHESIDSISIERTRWARFWTLGFWYTPPGKKRKVWWVGLVPPRRREPTRSQKLGQPGGVLRARVTPPDEMPPRRYAANARSLYQRALPPDIQRRARWQI